LAIVNVTVMPAGTDSGEDGSGWALRRPNVRPILIASLCAAALGLTAECALAETAHSPKPFAGHELSPEAKITMAEAQAIALKARPGQITDRELEKEGGGSGLRYSFDVKAQGVTYEVGVDAKTGKVLENAKEGPHPD
jgi:hypothetical protein